MLHILKSPFQLSHPSLRSPRASEFAQAASPPLRVLQRCSVSHSSQFTTTVGRSALQKVPLFSLYRFGITLCVMLEAEGRSLRRGERGRGFSAASAGARERKRAVFGSAEP